MPVVIIGGIDGPGWGCTCRAFRLGEPDGLTVLRAIARAVDVQFELIEKKPDDKLDFLAWTDPERTYDVTYDPGASGGFCKHIAACAAYLAGDWLKIGFEQIREEQEWKRTAQKELKALQRKLAKQAR